MRKKLQRNLLNADSFQPRLPFDTIDTKNDFPLRVLHEMFIKFKLFGAGNAEATIRKHRYYFSLLLKFNNKIKLEDLTEVTIINFLEYLNTRERKIGKEYVVKMYKNSSIAIVRSTLNIFLIGYLNVIILKLIPWRKFQYLK